MQCAEILSGYLSGGRHQKTPKHESIRKTGKAGAKRKSKVKKNNKKDNPLVLVNRYVEKYIRL